MPSNKTFIALILFILLVSGCSQNAQQNSLSDIAISTSPPPVEGWWHPSPGLIWQWQLEGEINFDIIADVYDFDAEVLQSTIANLHDRGAKAICYISVGSYENWRADAVQFPLEVLGKNYQGWPGEKWLDIRRIDLLAPIMRARLDLCAAKGFDAVEPDNLEIYKNDTGFPLTYQDQLRYAKWLANEAHARGMAIGLKNAPEMVSDLVDLFDFAISEDCFYYEWCEQMLPFIQAGKPVFAAEYTDLDGDFAEYCQLSDQLGFSTILKERDLGAWIETCP